MDSSFRLPTELWVTIIQYALLDGLLPWRTASLFDHLEVFDHPCKLRDRALSTRTRLCLVCWLWNGIIQQLKDKYLFLELNPAEPALHDDFFSMLRLDILGARYKCCWKWPCALSYRNGRRCPHRERDRALSGHNDLLQDATKPMDARVVRIYGSTNPVKLLKACQNLEALRVQCDGFRKTIASLPTITHKLTHLHLEAVRDALPQDIHRLDLPELVYAKLMLRLNGRTRQGVHAFPLEMHMPNVKTLYIGGLVKEGWGTELEYFILSAKNSLVNLLLAYDTRSTFSFRKLIEFSRLSTLGLYPQGPSPSNLDAVHLPTPLTLVVLRLDDYDWVRSLNRKEQMNSFTQLLTVLAASITDLVIPFKWRELEDLWVQWCDKFGPTDGDDPLPCPWSWLDQIDRDRASPILDRDQVSLRDDDGAAFASRMRECTEKFMDRRREQALSLQILSLQGALPPVAGPVTTSEFGIEPTSIPATDVPLAYPLLPDSVSS